LPEEIFGLAGDLTRWELRGDSFHKPRPFNFNTTATAPVQSTFQQNSHGNNDSFFSNIEVHNVFQLQERSNKFTFDNRRSGEIEGMMVDNGSAYMNSHFSINNQSSNSMYQTQQRAQKHDDLDHYGPTHHEDIFFNGNY
jgi:hypothetical protein